MYDNIGKKIKIMAKIIFAVMTIAGVVAGISLADTLPDDAAFLVAIIILASPVVAWVSSWILYAFGEMVEDIHAMRTKYYPLTEEAEVRKAEEKARFEAEEKARREAEEKARREAEEREKQEAEEEQHKGQKCQLCEGYFEHLTICEIKDDMGTKYRKICDGCMHTHNAKKVVL